MKNAVEMFKDSQLKWRWRLRAEENGKILCGSSEGYENYEDADTAMRRSLTALSSVTPFSVKVVSS